MEWGARRGHGCESRLFILQARLPSISWSAPYPRPHPFQLRAFPVPEAAGDSGGPGPGTVSFERQIPAAAETLGPHPDWELGVLPYLLEPSALPRAGERGCWVCPEAV